MSDQEGQCDPVCRERGIPSHLHQAGRPVDPDFEAQERLYRRSRSKQVEPASLINFRRMSVNREKYCQTPEDVLWNDDAGGKHPDEAIFALPVAALSLRIPHPEKDHPYSFGLKPIHQPKQCNFAHTEITAFRIMSDGTEEELPDIKPTSVKLQMRQELVEYLELHHPVGS